MNMTKQKTPLVIKSWSRSPSFSHHRRRLFRVLGAKSWLGFYSVKDIWSVEELGSKMGKITWLGLLGNVNGSMETFFALIWANGSLVCSCPSNNDHNVFYRTPIKTYYVSMWISFEDEENGGLEKAFWDWLFFTFSMNSSNSSIDSKLMNKSSYKTPDNRHIKQPIKSTKIWVYQLPESWSRKLLFQSEFLRRRIVSYALSVYHANILHRAEAASHAKKHFPIFESNNRFRWLSDLCSTLIYSSRFYVYSIKFC